MKIPREFEQRLFQFISQEVRNPDGPRTSAELAVSCGQFTRRWFGVEEITENFVWEKGVQLIAWSERLGKCVGEFYFNQKEG